MDLGLNATSWGQSSLLIDRRSSPRVQPSEEGTHLWLENDVRVAVEVVDVSEDGIGIMLPDMSFAVGPTLTVDYEGERREATVAWLQRAGVGDAFRMGLEWCRSLKHG